MIGCRLQLLGDDYVRNAGGEAMLVAVTGRLGRYLLRLDGGKEKLIRLDSERFRLLRYIEMTGVGLMYNIYIRKITSGVSASGTPVLIIYIAPPSVIFECHPVYVMDFPMPY